VLKSRLTFGAALLLIGITIAARPAAQAPSLAEVLQRSAAYVADFHKQLSGIVAEEDYRQEIANTSRFSNNLLVNPPRVLKSDLLLIRPADSNRYVELRDVFAVDGEPVRDRQARVEKLLKDRSAAAESQIASIIAESARYNIGTITRNINTPLMTLQFLEAARQPRFRFKHVDKAKPVFTNRQDAAANDAPLFRVSTEMWTIEYQERGGQTIIRRPDGRDLPAHGRFWIDPLNGSVLISELIVDGGGVIATVTVSYQSEPLMGFLVPVEMRESYVRSGERISGHAQYGKFRRIE
jgi:hypothetical protein